MRLDLLSGPVESLADVQVLSAAPPNKAMAGRRDAVVYPNQATLWYPNQARLVRVRPTWRGTCG